MTNSPRILLFTGDGKGKTTAAMGTALRAVGHGLPVFILQFLKNNNGTGERAVLGQLPGVRFLQTGKGFVPRPDDPKFPEHRAAAQQGLALAREAFTSGDYRLIVLDEICTAVSLSLLDEDQVEELVRLAPPDLSLVLTGRGATDRLIALADTVTEMRPIKHAYDNGRPAQKGVEF